MQIQLRWARYQSPASPRALPRPTNRSVSRGGGRERGSGGSKRKHPIEPTFSHGFDLRSHRGTIRCLASSVAPRCRATCPPSGCRPCAKKDPLGEGGAGFRLPPAVKCPEAQPLAFARTYMEASTDPFSAFNGDAKRQCQAAGPEPPPPRDSLPLLIPPPPGRRPWFQRVAYKVIPTTASRLPPTTNIPNSASRPSGAVPCSPDVVVWSVLKR